MTRYALYDSGNASQSGTPAEQRETRNPVRDRTGQRNSGILEPELRWFSDSARCGGRPSRGGGPARKGGSAPGIPVGGPGSGRITESAPRRVPPRARHRALSFSRSWTPPTGSWPGVCRATYGREGRSSSPEARRLRGPPSPSPTDEHGGRRRLRRSTDRHPVRHTRAPDGYPFTCVTYVTFSSRFLRTSGCGRPRGRAEAPLRTRVRSGAHGVSPRVPRGTSIRLVDPSSRVSRASPAGRSHAGRRRCRPGAGGRCGNPAP